MLRFVFRQPRQCTPGPIINRRCTLASTSDGRRASSGAGDPEVTSPTSSSASSQSRLLDLTVARQSTDSGPEKQSTTAGSGNATSSDAQRRRSDIEQYLRSWAQQTTAHPALHDARKQLQLWTVRNASSLRKSMDKFSANAQTAFQHAGMRLNEMTGYSEIEELKRHVVENEKKMHDVREETRNAKAAYEDAVARRAASQREVNELLQRKSVWTDADVSRFTALVRADHLIEQEEARAKAATERMDEATDRQFQLLMRSILVRYHEEQVWSDKIRSASTYGSLAALGLNLIVFVLAIVLVEPWKRRRLVQSFEQRVLDLNEGNRRIMEETLLELKVYQGLLRSEIQGAQNVPEGVTLPQSTAEPESEMEGLKEVQASASLLPRVMQTTMRSHETIVLSFAAGALSATLAGVLLNILLQ